MTTPKKKYRNKKLLDNNDNVEYSQEEAESLGISLTSSEEIQEDDEEEYYYEDEEEVELTDAELHERKRKKNPSPKGEFYVIPKEFDDQIMKYYESGVLSDELAEMVSKIAHKLSYAPNFINYSYREEMVGDGIIRMFKALMSKKYSHDKGSNPFSYFTRIAFNAFRNRIKKEKHIHETHERYQNEYLMFSENYNNMVKNNKSKLFRGNKE